MSTASSPLSRPYAEIRIQRVPAIVDDPSEAAFVLETEGPSGERDATAFDLSIEAAAGEDGGLAVLQASIPNLGQEVQNEIDADGRIEVVAGYKDATKSDAFAARNDTVPPTLMYVGEVQDVYSHVKSPNTVTRIEAKATASIMEEVSVTGTVEDVTLAAAAEALVGKLGGNVLLPPSADDYTVTQYTFKDDVLTELKRIARTLSHLTGRPHHVNPIVPQAEGVGFSSGQTSGGGATFGTGGASFNYAIVDTGFQETSDSVERLEFDWGEDTVYQASPEPAKAPTSQPISFAPEGGGGGKGAFQKLQKLQSSSMTYRFATPLDPRVFLGLRVDIVNDPKAGNEGTISSLTSVKHSLTDWRTVAEGPWQREDIDQPPKPQLEQPGAGPVLP